MTVVNWPASLGAAGISFNPRGMTVSGPRSLSGRSQVASVDSGFWTASYSRVNAGGATRVRLFRALRAQLEGGANSVRLPVADFSQAPWVLSGGVPVTSAANTKFTDGKQFTDGTSFLERAIKVALSAAATARATNISVTVTTAGTIAAGIYFSIDDRLYVIREILDDGSYVIWPPLREAATSGTPLNFDKPVCRMKLAGESEMDLALAFGRYGFPEVAFVEAN